MVGTIENIEIFSWNCRSLYNKLSELKIQIHREEPDIVCLQEIWLKKDYLPSFINYKSIHNSGVNSRGGGTALLVRSDHHIISTQMDISTTSGLDSRDYKGFYIC